MDFFSLNVDYFAVCVHRCCWCLYWDVNFRSSSRKSHFSFFQCFFVEESWFFSNFSVYQYSLATNRIGQNLLFFKFIELVHTYFPLKSFVCIFLSVYLTIAAAFFVFRDTRKFLYFPIFCLLLLEIGLWRFFQISIFLTIKNCFLLRGSFDEVNYCLFLCVCVCYL